MYQPNINEQCTNKCGECSIERLCLKWNECKPFNMPEDIYGEDNAFTTTYRNGKSLGPFLGVNTGKHRQYYFICSRYKAKNGYWS